MPRAGVTPQMAAALSAEVVRAAILVNVQFKNETLYMWSGLGPLAANGQTYIGVGDFGSVSNIPETSNTEAQNVTLTLGGIPATYLGEVIQNSQIFNLAQVWLACFDESYDLIPSPMLMYQGLTDQPVLSDDGESLTVTLALENVLVDLNRSVERYYTDVDQSSAANLAATLTRLNLPLTTIDTGGQYIVGIQNQVLYWGTSPSSSNNTLA
jgi:hypothetical protein